MAEADGQKERTLKLGKCEACDLGDAKKKPPHTHEEHLIIYRDLFGKEPLDIQEKASSINIRTKEMFIDTAVLVWERLRARVVTIDGNEPNWDDPAKSNPALEESLVYALTAEFGLPPVPSKN